MKLKTIYKTGAILALCAFCSVSNATITHINDMASFSFSSNNFIYDYDAGLDVDGGHIRTVVRDRQTISLDRFDSSLGQLLDVDIWFETDWELASLVRSYDSSSKASASGRGRSISNQAIRLVDPHREVERNREVIKVSCRDTPGCGSYNYGIGTFDGSFDLSNFSLNDFIGTDQIDFRIIRTLISDLTHCGPNDQCSLRNKYNSWRGSIFLSYTYDDSPKPVDNEVKMSIPEPSTLVLLGFGLLGIGATTLLGTKQYS